jgi:hypothetical protein
MIMNYMKERVPHDSNAILHLFRNNAYLNGTYYCGIL